MNTVKLNRVLEVGKPKGLKDIFRFKAAKWNGSSWLIYFLSCYKI